MLHEGAPQHVRYWNLFRRLSTPGEYWRCKLGMAPGDRLTFGFRNGLELLLPCIRMAEFKSIVMDDCYFRGFRRNAFDPAGRLAIVDVGANIGIFSVYAMSRFPRSTVYALEPLPENYSFLEANLARNRSRAFVSLRLAMAEKTGPLRLHLDVLLDEAFPTGATVIPPDHAGSAFKVSAVSLADLLEAQDIPTVHFLKLDCEGAEYEILSSVRPATLARVEAIAMEVHRGRTQDEDVSSLKRILQSQGFACRSPHGGRFLWAARDPSRLARQRA